MGYHGIEREGQCCIVRIDGDCEHAEPWPGWDFSAASTRPEAEEVV
jgi:hypothetical protein